MNIDKDIVIKAIYNNYKTQREISKYTNISLGKVNNILNELTTEGIINNNKLTSKGIEILDNAKVDTAIILAAGFGLRMIPINNIPKALVMVKGEVLIERLIKQLLDKGINKIYIVVGYMKEKFEYLIDKYNIKLIVNSDYKNYNNSMSLYKTHKYINNNTYIIPGDIYFINNPFNNIELVPYYTVSDKSDKGYYGINNKGYLLDRKDTKTYYNALGLAYCNKDNLPKLYDNLEALINTKPDAYWEDAMFMYDKPVFFAKRVTKDNYYEINYFEDLKAIDSDSTHLLDDNIKLIMSVFNCNFNDIKNITLLKKGMTNRSFLFEINNKKYIMRVPGEGTESLINRVNEANIYNEVNKDNICDNVIYINPNNGIKITEFINDSHNCDAYNEVEVKECMLKLREFHNKKIKVDVVFDLKENILKYEKLMNYKSLYSDYNITKENIFKLLNIINNIDKEYILCHIDSVPDNFLINNEGISLIDWEYAGMQDPHIDIAMFAIYAGYDKEWIDKLINYYFDNKVSDVISYKIYSYVAISGFLWSNWCEYKYQLGVEFGEYSLNQYRYAKVYSKIALEYYKENNNE